jgi:hypothetical protein
MTIQELISAFARWRRRFNDIDITQMAGLTIGTTVTKLKTANAIVYFLYNQQISKAATDNITMTACAQQAVNTFCYYLVSGDVNGTITVTKGVNNTYALPSTPAGQTAIGAFMVTTDGVTTFTSGTTALNASGITVSYYDIDTGVALALINQAQSHLEHGVTIVRKGAQRTIMDFDHMLVRVQVSLNEGDSTVVLPFPNFKDFVDEGINITDAAGVTTRLDKEDTLPIGVTPLEVRPTKISRRIITESVFTTDGFPGMEFVLWPTCDQAYTLDVQAYQYSPALDGVIYSRNWLTDNAPDILLFGALVESGLYFGADSQIKEWEARWLEAVWTLYAAQNKAKYSGSHIHTKFPNPIRQKGNMGMESSAEGILSYGFIGSSD